MSKNGGGAGEGGNMERVLRLMAEKAASDVYLSANTPILIKINGQIMQLSDQPLSHAQPRQLLAELLSPQQLEELDDTGELNVGVGITKVGSFRLSAFRQRGSIAAVFRCIPYVIPTLESLGLSEAMRDKLSEIIRRPTGALLVTGPTGSGKSTTLAAMIKSPHKYAPHRNAEDARQRRNLVIEKMSEAGLVTTAEAEQAKTLEIALVEPKKMDGSLAPYFVDSVAKQIAEKNYTDGKNLRVYTTIDAQMQEAAENSVSAGLAKLDRSFAKKQQQPQAALIALDPKNGHVLAMVGGLVR